MTYINLHVGVVEYSVDPVVLEDQCGNCYCVASISQYQVNLLSTKNIYNYTLLKIGHYK